MNSKITIHPPASGSEVVTATESKHIKPHQLQLLVAQMQGAARYDPRFGGSGQPLWCKNGGCNNAAMGTARKQLCPTHYVTFLERSNRAHEMPRCIVCNILTRNEFEGQPTCGTCVTAAEDTRRVRAADRVKRTELDNAETVHELREWIKEYML